MATSGMFSLPSISGSDEVHERVCSLCSKEDKDVEAVELCMDCEQFLCRSCSVQHGRFKSLQKHKVVQKDQVPNLSLSVLTGSEEAGFECTVCTIYGQYTAARVYCMHCCKYLCSVCENNHNQFGLLRNHEVKTVEEIRTEVSKSNNEDCQYVAIVKKPIRQKKLSCTSCKREIEDTQLLWKCIHCGFNNTCQECCGRHQSSNEGHRLISFKEFKVIYQQYGKSVISGSGKFMGPVCSKCCEKDFAKYPHMFCTECNIFVCISCKEDFHASHRTESEDVLEKAIADEIVLMENIEHDCSICLDRNLRSSADGYCLKCDVFICLGCTKMHTIYFGEESHYIRGLKEVNLRKEVFFQKSLYSAKEVIIDRCDYCIRKKKTTATAWKCLDCRKSLCIPCLDFHEIANDGHNLRIVKTEEEIKGKGDSKDTHKNLQSPIRKTEDYDQESLPGRSDKMLRMTIDLGSSRSGYTSIAFCFLKDLKDGNLDKIRNCLFGSCKSDLSKSCLLFDAAGGFHYFGEEAMTNCMELQSNGEADNWYFFDQYDKCLRDKTLTDKTKLLSANGNAINAGKVFGALTGYLTNYLLCRIPDWVTVNDIQLVYLTANPISTTCQSMLKNAAAKAGIDTDYVSFVSKATSIIKYIEMHSLPQEEIHSLPQEEIVGKLPDDFWKSEFRFLAADLGYDQAEISVYERLEDGTCRKADEHFGEWGLKKCVSECIEVFPLLFGQDVYEEFCKNAPMWLDEVTHDISVKLLDYYRPIYNKTINLKIPVELIDVFKERTGKNIEEEIQKLSKLLKVTMTGDMLCFEKSVLKTVVENCISKNTSLINTILTKHRIAGVIFFGTFLENAEIKNAMIENFDRAVLVPNKNAHLQAATFYDFRKYMKNCPFTYGIDICGDFHEEVHARDHQLGMISNNDICQNLFRRYYMKGENVNVGQLRFWRYKSVFPYQGKIRVNILQSDSKEPKYADESGIKELDVISVNLDSDVRYGEIEVRMMFRETGLLVEAFAVQGGTDNKNETLSKVYSKMFRHNGA